MPLSDEFQKQIYEYLRQNLTHKALARVATAIGEYKHKSTDVEFIDTGSYAEITFKIRMDNNA